MPGSIVNQGSTIICLHGDQAQPTGPIPQIRAEGQTVAVQTAPHTVVGCPFTTPAGNPQPCVTAKWMS